jgi:hypothetical protein
MTIQAIYLRLEGVLIEILSANYRICSLVGLGILGVRHPGMNSAVPHESGADSRAQSPTGGP